MRHFLAIYSSQGNLESGEIYISAWDIVEAQNKFFEFLKKRPLYEHMWNLNLQIKEITGSA